MQNGIVVAFNLSKDPYIKKQSLALSKQMGIDYKIYENTLTVSLLDECAKRAYLEGYEAFYILTDEGLLAEAESIIKKLNLFETVSAIPKYYSKKTAKFKESDEKLKLIEQTPLAVPPKPTAPIKARPQAVAVTAGTLQAKKKLLVLGVLNANPMKKGHGDLIREILTINVQAAVAMVLPGFSPDYNQNRMVTKIYLRPAESPSHAPIPANIRAGLLSTGAASIPGLYGNNGVAPGTFDLQPNVFINGFQGEDIYTTLKLAVRDATNLLVVTSKDMLAEVENLFGAQKNFNTEDNFKITVLPLAGNFKDVPDDALVSAGIRIGQDSIWKAEDKSKTVPEKKLEIKPSDFFACGLITLLHSISQGKVPINEKGGETGLKYLAELWGALPAGDRELLVDVANNVGIGKIFSAIKDIGKTAVKAGEIISKASGTPGAIDPKDLEEFTKMQEAFEKMGYNLYKILQNSEYKAFKSQLDLPV